VSGRHIDRDDFRRLIAELAVVRNLHEPGMDGGAERLLEQLLKTLNREKRS
jgi:hypothetical protein